VPTLLRDVVSIGGARTQDAAMEQPELDELAAAATLAERMTFLEQILRAETARVLKLAPERIGSNQAFGQLGIDSLMALELIRRVNAALGLALPATAVFNYPTLTALATQILKRLGMETMNEALPIPATTVKPQFSLHSQNHVEVTLSDEDAMRALMEPDLMESGESAIGD
jgi:acyl carrier protein